MIVHHRYCQHHHHHIIIVFFFVIHCIPFEHTQTQARTSREIDNGADPGYCDGDGSGDNKVHDDLQHELPARMAGV